MKSWICALALGGLAAFSTPALADTLDSDVIEQTAGTLPANGYVWNDGAAEDAAVPVTVIVSIPDQRAYVYRGMTLVAATTVSTGKAGKATPLGSYQILQKKVDHKSSLYNAAAMPYMQRLTWDGIALHAGQNPGFPNSHGCIRLPTEFAKKLFEVTKLGTTVTVTNEATYYVPAADGAAGSAVEAARR